MKETFQIVAVETQLAPFAQLASACLPILSAKPRWEMHAERIERYLAAFALVNVQLPAMETSHTAPYVLTQSVHFATIIQLVRLINVQSQI